MSAAASSSGRFVAQLPDPGRFWIRYRHRGWPGPESPWTELAQANLGWSDPTSALGLDRPADDLLYLPPVDDERAAERDEAARRHLRQGTPLLVQLRPGDSLPPEGSTVIYDLLGPLIHEDLDSLGEVAAGTAAVWPLIPGLTDEPSQWEEGCSRLAAAGIACVQPITLHLNPASRRRLIEELIESRWEETFHALFHRSAPPERNFSRVVHRHGMDIFLRRPLPSAPLRGIENRRLAGELTLASELWLRLGRPVSRGLDMSTAARWIDRSSYDLTALIREGNLGLVEEIDPETRALLAGWPEAGRLTLLDELIAEYAAPSAVEEEE